MRKETTLPYHADKGGSTITTLPYHADYGLPDVIRIRAVHIAKAESINTATVVCNVCKASVYRWLGAYARETNG